MSRRAYLRWITAAAVALVIGVVTVLLLVATDTLLSVWERLGRAAPWLGSVYLLIIFAAAIGTGWVVWRLLTAGKKSQTTSEPLDEEQLRERLERRQNQGVDVGETRQELEELERRRSGGRLYLAFFGEASSGKSALIRGLLPGAHSKSAVTAGTTTQVDYHDWDPEDGVPVRIADLPGFGQHAGDELAELAREEALRAHLVAYVCDADISRSQFQELRRLAGFNKPLVVALNKADRYSAEELGAIEERIREQLADVAAYDVVPVSAGTREEVRVELADGRSELQLREREADVAPLAESIREVLTGERERLDRSQQEAGLRLATEKLADAETRFRRQQAETLVERYARRAVVGALAAVTPGTDIVIQGALATALVKQLTELYEVPVGDLDVDRFLRLAGNRIGRATAVVLAVAGNALKAFPGVGTLAGGLVHAVAYGLIFDSMGRAIATCLEEQSQFQPERIIETLDDELEKDLGRRARRFARLALSRRSRPDGH